MTTYTAREDYPTNFDSGKNLVASGWRANYTWTAGGKSFGLFYDVYLDQFYTDGRSNPFLYRFTYWGVEITSSPASGYVPATGASKFKLDSYMTITDVQNASLVFYALKSVSAAGETKNLPENGPYYWADSSAWSKLDTTAATHYNWKMPQGSPPDASTDGEQTTPKDFNWTPKVETPGPPRVLYSAKGKPWQGPGGAPVGSSGGTSDTPADGTTDTTGDGTTEENSYLGYTAPKKRQTLFNPPLIATATGAYVGVHVGDDDGEGYGYKDLSAPNSYSTFLGTGGSKRRINRKGTIRQYILNEKHWEVAGESGSVVTGYSGKKSNKKTEASWNQGDSILDDKYSYGFRFHYNPSEIAFTAAPVDGVDPAVIMSPIEMAMPVIDGATISMNLYLNRIEDMSMLSGENGKAKDPKVWRRSLYSVYGNKQITDNDVSELARRGTGYDLEFLFRAALGRPYKTALRKTTADVGIIVGLPLILDLGPGMRYSGRLSSLSYTHNSFTENMTPMFTTVSIGFSRFPDAQTFKD